MTPSKNDKQAYPSVEYQLVEDVNGLVESAFDILFEATLEKYGNLTTNDN